MKQTIEELQQVLKKHKEKYPEMELTDIVKLIYQNEFGGGHLIPDEEASLQWIQQEYENCRLSSHEWESPLWESIGNGSYRLSLQCLEEGLAATTLNRMFAESAKQIQGSVSGLEQKLALLQEESQSFSEEEIAAYLTDYREKGYPPVSHSARFRQQYAPAYRVVTEAFHQVYPVCLAIDKALAKQEGTKPFAIAIDGLCGGGKTTLARILAEIYDCNVFHMDDYFLRPEQRTEERYAQAGGNVDYERFREEVLAHLGEPEGITYQPFDCRTFTLAEKRHLPAKRITIVEGSYSCHPYFGEAVYDLRFFVDISRKAQQERILLRNGEEMLQRFIDLWIPYENKYFETYQIKEKCNRVEMNL